VSASAIVALATIVFKFFGALMTRLDEATKRRLIVLALDALRVKVEDAVIDRAVAAYDAADGVQHSEGNFRD
jgi:hypothetical protein